MVAGKIANMAVGNPDFKTNQESYWTNSSDSTPNAQAAQKLNVGTRSVNRAKKVIAEAEPEVIAAVEAGSMAVSTAAKAKTGYNFSLPATCDCPFARKTSALIVVSATNKLLWIPCMRGNDL